MKESPKVKKNDTKKKEEYKITNWREYNKALINRGSLTIWISDDLPKTWSGTGRFTYSNQCIETLLMVKALYKQPLRAAVGLTRSVFALAGIVLPTPDYTTISRRAKTVIVRLKKRQKETTHLVLDSTGVKVYGEGEWKVRKHGWSKRRVWKKIHIGIDEDGEIRAVDITDSDAHDCSSTDTILKQEDAQITDFYGDGAYDTFDVYSSLLKREVTGFHIPPQVNAKIRQHGNCDKTPHPRDENLRAIRKSTRRKWKQASGYHRRSLGENVMFRYKTIFGQHLSFRTDESQVNEVMTKCNLLNAFFGMGMPKTVRVE
jgi:hypothetical protein